MKRKRQTKEKRRKNKRKKKRGKGRKKRGEKEKGKQRKTKDKEKKKKKRKRKKVTTRSIVLQFTQDLHLLIAYHQTKTLISRFFLLMPPFLRSVSFLFVLQSQPFYQAQLVPVTTISIRRSSLARVEEA